MRHLFLALLLGSLAACSSSERSPDEPMTAEEAAAHTDECLDHPELSKTWGDCNVKHTLFEKSAALSRCRKASPKAKGTVNFQLHVHSNGTVKSVKPLGGSGKHTYCVVKVMKGLRFAPPPAGKEPVITIPYQLEP